MSAGAPWSVKGIDPKAREIAKDLARRSGMTLGEWLNQVILDDEVGPETQSLTPRYPSFGRQERSEPRRYEGYSRTVDDAFRSTEALDRLSARIEAAEHRAAGAIGGIEEAVSNLVSRLESDERENEAVGARIEGVVDGLRAEQARAADRLRRIEQESAESRTPEVLRALKSALAKMVTQFAADRDHAAESFDGLRQELDGVHERLETAFSDDDARDLVDSVIVRLSARLEQAEQRTSDALRGLEKSFTALDGRLKATEARLGDDDYGIRLDALAVDLTGRIESIRAEMAEAIAASAGEGRFAQIDQALAAMDEHVQSAEKRSVGAIEQMGQDVLRMADTMQRSVEEAEARNSQSIDTAVDRASKLFGREVARLDEAVTGVSAGVKGLDAQFASAVQDVERRSAETVAEVERRTQAAMNDVEQRASEAVERVGGEVTRVLDQRLGQSDAASAQALEKLSGEIARITDRLTERIANAERRSAQAIDDVGEQVARVSDRLQERYERASVDLNERIRLSEERTGRLLEDARERVDQRLADVQRRAADPLPGARAEAADFDAYADPAVAPFGGGAVEPEDARSLSQGLIDHITRDLGQNHEDEPHEEAEIFRAEALSDEDEHDHFLAHDDDLIEAVEPEAMALPAVDIDFDDPFETEDALIEPAETPVQDEGFGSGLFSASASPEVASGDDDDWLSSTNVEQAFAEPAEAHSDADFDALLAPTPHLHDADEELDHDVQLAALAAHPADDQEDDGVQPHVDALADVTFEAADDFVSEPQRPRTTRELIEQARAAARASSAADGKSKGKGDKAGGSLFGGLGRGTKKKRGGSAMRAALVVSGSAAAMSVAAASYIILDSKPRGSLPDRVASALGGRPSTAHPATNEVAPNPFAALALSPKPIAGQVAANQQANLSTTVAGSGGAELYNDAVRRIEARDNGGVPLLQKAANLGYAPAQFYLGKLYEDGQAGLSKDLVEARRWTQRAAEGGDRKAMHNLALYFFEGAGGPKNLSSAADWFRRAAGLGLTDSQYNLARLYEEGLGVAQNPAEAYKWYVIAARAGDGDSKMSALRIKSQLSPEAQNAAQRAADGFAVQTASAPMTAPSLAMGPGNDVATAQRALAKLGFYQGPADGASSPALKLAIAAYQRGQGLPATGALDPTLGQRFSTVLQQ